MTFSHTIPQISWVSIIPQIPKFSNSAINCPKMVKYLYILGNIWIFSIFINFQNRFSWWVDAIDFVNSEILNLHSWIPPVRGLNRFTVKTAPCQNVFCRVFRWITYVSYTFMQHFVHSCSDMFFIPSCYPFRISGCITSKRVIHYYIWSKDVYVVFN